MTPAELVAELKQLASFFAGAPISHNYEILRSGHVSYTFVEYEMTPTALRVAVLFRPPTTDSDHSLQWIKRVSRLSPRLIRIFDHVYHHYRKSIGLKLPIVGMGGTSTAYVESDDLAIHVVQLLGVVEPDIDWPDAISESPRMDISPGIGLTEEGPLVKIYGRTHACREGKEIEILACRCNLDDMTCVRKLYYKQAPEAYREWDRLLPHGVARFLSERTTEPLYRVATEQEAAIGREQTLIVRRVNQLFQ